MEICIHTEAWVTLATNDSYALGALVLAHSLRRVHTNRHITVLITPEVSQGMREHLASVFHSLTEVNVLDSSDDAHLALMQRPELGITFTKLHCWRLTQFSKCVFLDADTMVLQNCDELFEREELSAAADCGWPDCFNSGVFVFRPSNETFMSILNFAVQKGSFDGGDQGLLNLYFGDWATKDISRHLPFIYNMTSSAAYSYLPAYTAFGKDVKIVHFLGSVKPWMQGYNPQTHQVEQRSGSFHAQEHLQMWWDTFMREVQPRLQPDYAGLAGQLALMVVGFHAPPEGEQDERARQLAWESGHVDYLGRDSFENIQKKLDEAISSTNGAEAQVAAPVVAPTAAVPVSPPPPPAAVAVPKTPAPAPAPAKPQPPPPAAAAPPPPPQAKQQASPAKPQQPSPAKQQQKKKK